MGELLRLWHLVVDSALNLKQRPEVALVLGVVAVFGRKDEFNAIVRHLLEDLREIPWVRLVVSGVLVHFYF